MAGKLDTRVAPVHIHPDTGVIHAKGSRDDIYTVTLGAPDGPTYRCTCIAGQNGRLCYHVRSARARFAHFFPAPYRNKPQIG